MSERRMKLGSLFSGQEGFGLAGMLSGIDLAWSCEIEPSAMMVLKARFPNIAHYSDVSALKGGDVEPVNIITFGSPCQDLSVAGKRKGMKHSLNGDEDQTRSGLFFDAVRIIEEMRGATNNEFPRYALWENVLGSYSSAKGEDFRRVLEELCQVADENAEVPHIGKWPGNGEIIGSGYSLAWRTFDAQYFGVPQRRRRVYLLVDYQSENAGKVMFRNEGREFLHRQRAWTEFAKTVPQMTADECVAKFNEQPIPESEDFGVNEPSGKFARLDMNTGLWDTRVPDGYFIGEKPYYQNPTKLSEILIPNADPKYYLSAKACQGILRRAEQRGKQLPEVLRIALERQANSPS